MASVDLCWDVASVNVMGPVGNGLRKVDYMGDYTVQFVLVLLVTGYSVLFAPLLTTCI